MNELQLINEHGKIYADSRQVAEIIGKDHAMLMRSIRNYEEILATAKLQAPDFFIKSSYLDNQEKRKNLICTLCLIVGATMMVG